MRAFLERQRVLLDDVGSYAKWLSEQVNTRAQAVATKADTLSQYLAGTNSKSRGQSKKDLPQSITDKDHYISRPICMSGAPEPCISYDIFTNGETMRFEVVRRWHNCLHYDLYFLHSEDGFYNAAVQAPLPFQIPISVNARESRTAPLAANGIALSCYTNANCSVTNCAPEQRLAARRSSRPFDGLTRQVNPHVGMLRRSSDGSCWRLANQAELTTDVAFSSR